MPNQVPGLGDRRRPIALKSHHVPVGSPLDVPIQVADVCFVAGEIRCVGIGSAVFGVIVTGQPGVVHPVAMPESQYAGQVVHRRVSASGRAVEALGENARFACFHYQGGRAFHLGQARAGVCGEAHPHDRQGYRAVAVRGVWPDQLVFVGEDVEPPTRIPVGHPHGGEELSPAGGAFQHEIHIVAKGVAAEQLSVHRVLDVRLPASAGGINHVVVEDRVGRSGAPVGGAFVDVGQHRGNRAGVSVGRTVEYLRLARVDSHRLDRPSRSSWTIAPSACLLQEAGSGPRWFPGGCWPRKRWPAPGCGPTEARGSGWPPAGR